MKLMRILDDESVEQVDELYLDGYFIDDQTLEGLSIKLTLNQEGKLIATADWPIGLDPVYWSDKAVDYAMKSDGLSTDPELIVYDDGFVLFETGQD
jgi:hypothetical protein